MLSPKEGSCYWGMAWYTIPACRLPVAVCILVPDCAISGVHTVSCWCLLSNTLSSLHWHKAVPIAQISLICRGRLHPYSHIMGYCHSSSPTLGLPLLFTQAQNNPMVISATTKLLAAVSPGSVWNHKPGHARAMGGKYRLAKDKGIRRGCKIFPFSSRP